MFLWLLELSAKCYPNRAKEPTRVQRCIDVRFDERRPPKLTKDAIVECGNLREGVAAFTGVFGAGAAPNTVNPNPSGQGAKKPAYAQESGLVADER